MRGNLALKSAWEEVQPNQIYRVFKKIPLTQAGNEGLIYLYQPIIGAQALALYFGFLGDAYDHHENEFVHLDMLDALNIGLPDFLKARKQLEGMGLLRVFVKEDPEFGRMFLYQLEEPVHPQEFFKDSTYSFLLTNFVGERKFRQLEERFRPKQVDTSAYREITHHFREIYGKLNEDHFSQKSSELDRVAQAYQIEPATLVFDQNDLDWDFLQALAKKKFIAIENFTNDFKRQLSLYHDLYGYDELTLVNLMSDVVQLADGKVEPKKLSRWIEQKNHRPESTKSEFATDQNQVKRFNTLRQNGFSEADIQVIQMSEENAPYAFLEALKKEKHSFVTNSESWLLKSLVEKSPLPNSVINVLLHYVLVVQNNTTLQAKFVDKIATDWSEKEIKSPEAAITHVRGLVKEAKTTKNNRTWERSASQKHAVRKEVLPDWVDKPQVDIEDKEKEAAINQRLQEYLKRKEGGN